MIYNYLKIIFLNFLTGKMYTFIIVFGLAVGIAVTLMIAQYIHFELSFDRHVSDKVRVYYAYLEWRGLEKGVDGKCFPAIGPFFENSLPEVEAVIILSKRRI